jgi:hypothetical protein
MPKKPAGKAGHGAAGGKGLGKSAGASKVAAASASGHKSDKARRRELAAERRRTGHASYVSEVATLRKQLGEAGLMLREVAGDGNCLFRAVSDQLYGNECEHGALRGRCCDYLAAHADAFAPFLLEEEGYDSFDAYVRAMRADAEWAGNMELQALSLCLRVNFVIHQAGQPHWELVNDHPREAAQANGGAGGKGGKGGGSSGAAARGARTLHLAYQEGDHYNSVRGARDDTAAPAAQIVFADGRTTVAPAPEAQPASAGKGKGKEAHSRGGGGSGSGGSSDHAAALAAVTYALPTGVLAAVGAARVRELLADLDGDADACVELLLGEAAAAPEVTAPAGGAGRSSALDAAAVPESLRTTRAVPEDTEAGAGGRGRGGAGTAHRDSGSSARAGQTADVANGAHAVGDNSGTFDLLASAGASEAPPATSEGVGSAGGGAAALTAKSTQAAAGSSAGPDGASSLVTAAAAAKPPRAAAAASSSSMGLGNGIKRSKPCPCGSGRPYKRCHEDIDRAAATRAAAVAAGAVVGADSAAPAVALPPPPPGLVSAVVPTAGGAGGRGNGGAGDGSPSALLAAVRI